MMKVTSKWDPKTRKLKTQTHIISKHGHVTTFDSTGGKIEQHRMTGQGHIYTVTGDSLPSMEVQTAARRERRKTLEAKNKAEQDARKRSQKMRKGQWTP